MTVQQASATAALGEPLIEQRERDEPPERRVDAAQVPEIRLPALGGDELWDLAVRCLIARERLETDRCSSLEHAVSGNCHAERADRRVAAEDRRIAAFLR